jgi:hypothetical protein
VSGAAWFMRPYAAHRAILNVRGAVFRLVHGHLKVPPLNFCTLSQMSQPRTAEAGNSAAPDIAGQRDSARHNMASAVAMSRR